jgi:uncharacterized protein YndB with AHSA1/START domain
MTATQNSRIIPASPEIIYRAFTDPDALVVWLAPGNMTGRIHNFNLKEGGGYEMSLFYPESETEAKGKTAGKEDRFTARFVKLIPSEKIIEAITFDSPDPAFKGVMMMEVTLNPVSAGTEVTVAFSNIPSGIKAEDNEEGTRLSLEQLSHYLT